MTMDTSSCWNTEPLFQVSVEVRLVKLLAWWCRSPPAASTNHGRPITMQSSQSVFIYWRWRKRRRRGRGYQFYLLRVTNQKNRHTEKHILPTHTHTYPQDKNTRGWRWRAGGSEMGLGASATFSKRVNAAATDTTTTTLHLIYRRLHLGSLTGWSHCASSCSFFSSWPYFIIFLWEIVLVA